MESKPFKCSGLTLKLDRQRSRYVQSGQFAHPCSLRERHACVSSYVKTLVYNLYAAPNHANSNFVMYIFRENLKILRAFEDDYR